jgi:NAD(P)-dependent dehydrogenase (short-subunit alcohol dehydrogenase family)
MAAANRPIGTVSYDNAGRVVMVTGGSNGIGRATCEAFQQTGAQVICVDVEPPGTQSPLPPSVAFYRADVADEANCRDAVAWAVDQFEGLDVLVNNAAIQPVASYVPLHELAGEIYQRMVAVNLTGYTNMAKYALAVMTQQRSGVIINLASAQGQLTARQVGVYGPLKAANRLQAKQWGVEYARWGIRVLSVSPGAIDTPLVRASLEKQGGASALANRHPVGRLGQPIEVARAILWLASDDASFVTAADLPVDGGISALGAWADPYPMRAHDASPAPPGSARWGV